MAVAAVAAVTLSASAAAGGTAAAGDWEGGAGAAGRGVAWRGGSTRSALSGCGEGYADACTGAAGSCTDRRATEPTALRRIVRFGVSGVGAGVVDTKPATESAEGPPAKQKGASRPSRQAPVLLACVAPIVRASA